MLYTLNAAQPGDEHITQVVVDLHPFAVQTTIDTMRAALPEGSVVLAVQGTDVDPDWLRASFRDEGLGM